MSIKINHNILSILVQRNMDRTSTMCEQSSARLSSGERINTAADDPAGLAMSEGVRYEIQGLRQNQKNVTGAVGLLGTAESDLDSMVDLAQRARELAVQAGSDTLNANDRKTIQTELSQILDEMNHTASTSKYNDQSLLNGQLQGVTIQTGTSKSDSFTVSLPDFHPAALGAWAAKSSDLPVSQTALAAGDVQINGIQVPASKGDSVSTAAAAASAIAKATAINSVESSTGVHATAQAAKLAGSAAVQGPLSLDGTTQTLKINGVSISPVKLAAGEGGATLVSQINFKSATTGVTAALDSSGKLTLSAADGRNIEVVTQGGVGGALGLAAAGADVNTVASGTVRLTSNQTFSIGDPNGSLGMAAASQQVNPDPATALQSLDVGTTDGAAKALQSLDAALAQLSRGRSTIGALNNRLDQLNNSLASRIENLTKTDSSIRDTDFAYESARLTQSQILQQAGLAILTQANVAPKRALELLQAQ